MGCAEEQKALEKSASEVLRTRGHLKIGLNPSAKSGQPTNLVDFVFGLMTDPQEELLENRAGVAFPHPWGHKNSFPGALLPGALFLSQGLSPGVALSGLIPTPQWARRQTAAL